MTVSAISRPGERERLVVKLGEVDWLLCALLTIVAGVGTVMLYSIGGMAWTPFAARHLIMFAVCFGGMLVLATMDLRIWFALAYPIYGLGIMLLFAVAVFGHTTLGAKRWLSLGPILLQPSEFMKIALVIGLARFYHGLTSIEARWSWRLLVPIAMIGLPAALVAHQPDLGTALLIAGTGVLVMILAGLAPWIIAAGLVLVGVGTPLAFQFVLKGYQKARLLTFMNPEADKSGAGYHIIQSEIALGSGGLLGKGLGLGTQSQLNFLPEKSTDFMFAAMAEEMGMLGCIAVLLVYALIVMRTLQAASVIHSQFGRLAAGGVAFTFALCVLINGAMVMGLAPVVGVPMPLLSWGGTVMITMMGGFGLVLCARVHRYSQVTSGHGSFV